MSCYVVHDGRAEPFDGDLDDYAKWLAETDARRVSDRCRMQRPQRLRRTSPERRRDQPRSEKRIRRRAQTTQARGSGTPQLASRLRAAPSKNARRSWSASRSLQADIQAQLESPDIYAEGAKDRLRQLTEQQGRLAREVEEVEAPAGWSTRERLETETRRA